MTLERICKVCRETYTVHKPYDQPKADVCKDCLEGRTQLELFDNEERVDENEDDFFEAGER